MDTKQTVSGTSPTEDSRSSSNSYRMSGGKSSSSPRPNSYQNDSSNEDAEILARYNAFRKAMKQDKFKRAIDFVHPKSRIDLCGKLYFGIRELLSLKKLPEKARKKLRIDENSRKFRNIRNRHSIRVSESDSRRMKKEKNTLSYDEKHEIYGRYFAGPDGKKLFVDLMELIQSMQFDISLFDAEYTSLSTYHVRKVAENRAKIEFHSNGRKKNIHMKKKTGRWYLVYNQ